MLDIRGRKIAFSCTDLLNTTKKHLLEVLGTPEIEPLARVDGMPLQNGLPTQSVVDWVESDDEDIRLLDIGESFLQGRYPRRF